MSMMHGPKVGDTRYNGAADQVEIFDGSSWRYTNITGNISSVPNNIVPTGRPTGSLATDHFYRPDLNVPLTTSSEMAIMTPHGRVSINFDTGVLTIPPGIGRDEAIRDFWLGFQENFRGAEKAKYENKISELNKRIDVLYRQTNSDVKKRIAKKIAEKYKHEKFIMVKPADLIKIIEEI